jgi:hypothetical protein
MMSRLEEMRGQARNEDERRMIDEIMKRMK